MRDQSNQSIRGNRNVQIQDVDRSLIEITYNEMPRTVPLEPALIPPAKRLPSPARLVRAHSGVVPYVDRGGLLENLSGWVDEVGAFAGQVIGGRGGSGKTRLAVELCQVLRERDWLCGFLARIADPTMLDALVQTPTARLVVVDYAEARVEHLEQLLPLLRASASAAEPVRVLLLTRTAGSSEGGGWADRLRNRVDSLDAVLDECEERILEETPLDEDNRAELFREAGAAFATRLESPPPPPDLPDLGEDVFGSPLMIVIAAYLAAQGGDTPSTRAELLDEVLGHERRYWRDSADDLSADAVLLERVVALATLVNAESEDQAARLLGLLPDLADAPAERRNRLARWVREQYPGPRWWNPLEPDLVGERLVAAVFGEHPEVPRKVLEGDEPDLVTRPLEVLARVAADDEAFAEVLRPVLGDQLRKLCEVAVAQAEGTGERGLLYGSATTVASALASAVERVEVGLPELNAGMSVLPRRSNILLNQLHAALSEREVAVCRRGVEPSYLARALRGLSQCLANVGRIDEALEASQEAVDIVQRLTVTDPSAHGPSLAGALDTLSVRLAALGRRDEALTACRRAADILRPLAAEDPATHGWSFASALNNLSVHLGHANEPEEALEASRAAVQTYRSLAESDPAGYAADLAMALNTLSIRYADFGNHDEALAMIEESIRIRRPLAAANPAAYGSDLAMALNSLSIHLAAEGRLEEAIDAAEESIRIRRPMVAANPSGHGHALGITLYNLSIHLMKTDQPERGAVAAAEAAEIFSLLAPANPGAVGGHFVESLLMLRDCLRAAGRDEEADAIERELKAFE